MTLVELFSYYNIYCTVYRVNPHYIHTPKRFITAFKGLLGGVLYRRYKWKEAGVKIEISSKLSNKEGRLVLTNLVSTPWTENILLQLKAEVERRTTDHVFIPELLGSLEPAHFEKQKKWVLPRKEAASPVSLTDGHKVGFIGMEIMGVPMVRLRG